MNYYVHALKNYAQFSGRARRKEYNYFILVHAIIIIGFVILDLNLGTMFDDNELGLFSCIYLLSTGLPYLALFVRRLHDNDRIGWLALLLLVPCVGAIMWISFMFTDSQPGTNRFGPNPKEPSMELTNVNLDQ
jgi:uncharacterized membrane protein YhaH (DUF805 family)